MDSSLHIGNTVCLFVVHPVHPQSLTCWPLKAMMRLEDYISFLLGFISVNVRGWTVFHFAGVTAVGLKKNGRNNQPRLGAIGTNNATSPKIRGIWKSYVLSGFAWCFNIIPTDPNIKNEAYVGVLEIRNLLSSSASSCNCRDPKISWKIHNLIFTEKNNKNEYLCYFKKQDLP